MCVCVSVRVVYVCVVSVPAYFFSVLSCTLSFSLPSLPFSLARALQIPPVVEMSFSLSLADLMAAPAPLTGIEANSEIDENFTV